MGVRFSSYMKKQAPVDIFIDFQNAQPASPAETMLYHEVQKVLDRTPEFLVSIRSYAGAQELIRKAISLPGSEEANEAAWEGIMYQVGILKEYYAYTQQISDAFLKLVKELSKPEPTSPAGDQSKALMSLQSLARQLAKILEYALAFDEIKMTNAQLMNDYSFFRRQQSRFKRNNGENGVTMTDEENNRLSMFFAMPNPVMKTLCECLSNLFNEYAEQGDGKQKTDNMLACLAIFTNVCYSVVQKDKFQDIATVNFCMRAMTAAIILYDNVCPLGAFHKKTPIQMRNCLEKLGATIEGGLSTATQYSNLLNSIRYTGIHVNDETTPKEFKHMLGGALNCAVDGMTCVGVEDTINNAYIKTTITI